jgi:hypothetical protein
MRNGGELCPTLHVTVPAGAYARPDVTRNGKCAAHVSCISFGAAFGRLHRGARAIGGRGGMPKVERLRGGQPAKSPSLFWTERTCYETSPPL